MNFLTTGSCLQHSQISNLFEVLLSFMCMGSREVWVLYEVSKCFTWESHDTISALNIIMWTSWEEDESYVWATHWPHNLNDIAMWYPCKLQRHHKNTSRGPYWEPNMDLIQTRTISHVPKLMEILIGLTVHMEPEFQKLSGKNRFTRLSISQEISFALPVRYE